MNTYRDEVGRVLRLGDLKYEDGDRDKDEGGYDKVVTTMTPSTAKNATGMNKKKLSTTTAAKKIIIRRTPRSIMWSCGVSISYAGTNTYVQVNHMYGR